MRFPTACSLLLGASLSVGAASTGTAGGLPDWAGRAAGGTVLVDAVTPRENRSGPTFRTSRVRYL
jgi:hypothetical protein